MMRARSGRRRLIGIIGEATLFGLLCTILMIAWGLVYRKNLGWADYKFLVPTFLVGGGVIYAAGEAIAGRMAGSSVGAFLGLLGFGWLAGAIVGHDHVIARLVGPAIGFTVGALLGALGEKAIRRERRGNSLQSQ